MLKSFERVFILIAFLSGTVSAAEQSTSWTPTRDLIAVIESEIQLPEDYISIDDYVRFYAGEVENENRYVLATYRLREDVEERESGSGGLILNYPGAGHIRIIDKSELPSVMDGGCSIINVKYDVEQSRFVYVFCNGFA